MMVSWVGDGLSESVRICLATVVVERHVRRGHQLRPCLRRGGGDKRTSLGLSLSLCLHDDGPFGFGCSREGVHIPLSCTAHKIMCSQP